MIDDTRAPRRHGETKDTHQWRVIEIKQHLCSGVSQRQPCNTMRSSSRKNSVEERAERLRRKASCHPLILLGKLDKVRVGGDGAEQASKEDT